MFTGDKHSEGAMAHRETGKIVRRVGGSLVTILLEAAHRVCDTSGASTQTIALTKRLIGKRGVSVRNFPDFFRSRRVPRPRAARVTLAQR